jgi:PKD repeat protein
VTFTSTSTDSDGTVKTTRWDFDNDGIFDDPASKVVTRQFATPGLHTVTLEVTDDDGATDTLQKTVTVLNRVPTATIGMGTAAPVSLEPVVFTATAADQDGTVMSRLWDFDNDNQFDDGTGESVPWTFATKGAYTVRVKVTDNFGASAIATRVVNVANTLPRATFSHDPPSPNPREAVNLSSTSLDPDGSITAFAWDTDNDGAFDDGTTAKVTKTFLTSGNQTVRLRVTDNDGGQSIGSQTIVIGNRPPAASFDYRPAAPVAGQLVTMFSTASDPDANIESIDWDLDGDGAFEVSGSSAGRDFPAGSFNVSMRVTDTQGSFAIVTQTIVVSAPAPAPKSDTTRLRALTPFPIVRLAGRIGKRGTSFRVMTVDAPDGSTVTVRCFGRSCPFTKSTRAAKAGERLVYASRKVRIRKLERRLLRAGVTIKIYVTKAGTIGKYTSIKIRGGKPPKRVDRCLMPSSLKPVQCPS